MRSHAAGERLGCNRSTFSWKLGDFELSLEVHVILDVGSRSLSFATCQLWESRTNTDSTIASEGHGHGEKAVGKGSDPVGAWTQPIWMFDAQLVLSMIPRGRTRAGAGRGRSGPENSAIQISTRWTAVRVSSTSWFTLREAVWRRSRRSAAAGGRWPRSGSRAAACGDAGSGHRGPAGRP